MDALPPPPPAPVDGGRASRRSRRRAGRGQFDAGKPLRFESSEQHVDWMIREFKTRPCHIARANASHDHRCCPYYHNDRDRRRPVAVDGSSAPSYRGEPCLSKFDEEVQCPSGDACDACHSTAELLYHPDFFRKRLCHQARRCPRGNLCAFAHNREELLVPHFGENAEAEPTEEFIAYRFKTEWCPVGGPHDWENCVYAHTYRDWRRIPGIGYSSHPCPHWTSSVASGMPELSYAARCPYGLACPLAHGAKEQLYHPQFYKTNPCSDAQCRRGPLCAFTHGEQDARRMPVEEPLPKGVVRRPLPRAEEMLRQHQPTYAMPPMYHALEDGSRGGAGLAGAGGASRSRNRRGRGSNVRAYGYVAADAGAGMGVGGNDVDFVAEDANGGCGLQIVYSGYAPMVWGSPLGCFVIPPWPSTAATTTTTSSPGPGATLGSSPLDRLLAGLGPDAGDRSPQGFAGALPASSQVFHLQPLAPNAAAAAAPAAAAAVGAMPPLAMPRKQPRGVGDGWRTPSSFGSAPPSGTPTAASSPRTAEASSTGAGESSEHNSWDEAGRDAVVA